MLKFRRKPVIKHLTTLSSLNEPFVQVVYPEPPWWQNEGVAKVRDEIVNRLLEVDWPGVSEGLQNLLSRRRVREA